MLLGWGLRGYIGGGPYGALIPGSFVALSLCLLLGYRMETAAVAALFGAVGVGYGGNMTYGQTLGFLRDTPTIYWGVLGCLLKGGVWGLLGGAVLGMGLARDHYDRKTLLIAFLLTLPAFVLGVQLINEPKLLYFSDPVNKPRDESWAGLLFAAPGPARIPPWPRFRKRPSRFLFNLRCGAPWAARSALVAAACGSPSESTSRSTRSSSAGGR